MADKSEFARGPSLLLQIAGGAWVVAASVCLLDVFPDPLFSMYLWAAGLLLGCWWCLSALWQRGVRTQTGTRLDRRGVASWALCPLLALLVAALAHFDLPLIARVELNEDELLALVERVRRSDGEHAPDGFPERAGSFPIERIHRAHGCVFLQTDWTLSLAGAGLVHVPPDTQPPQLGYQGIAPDYRHLTGRWWAYVIEG